MPDSPVRLAVFADLHLRTRAELDLLVKAMQRAVDSWRVQGILVAGDLVQKGSAVSYPDYREAMAALPVAVVTCIGNHDDRSAFEGALRPLEGGGSSEPGAPVMGVVMVAGVRVVVLDTNVGDDGNGRIHPEHAGWLKRVLQEDNTELGTILMLHHPTFPSPLPDGERPMLLGRAVLADALTGTDVRVAVSGHYHHVGAELLGTTLVWAAPSFTGEKMLDSAEAIGLGSGRGWTLVRVDREGASCTVMSMQEEA